MHFSFEPDHNGGICAECGHRFSKGAATGDPLMGVGVIVSTGGGTVTDADGTYSFTYDGKQMMAMPDNTSTRNSDQ